MYYEDSWGSHSMCLETPLSFSHWYQEMLLQSWERVIRVFPGMPSSTAGSGTADTDTDADADGEADADADGDADADANPRKHAAAISTDVSSRK